MTTSHALKAGMLLQQGQARRRWQPSTAVMMLEMCAVLII
jgi:hypothetical protein